MEKEFVVVSVEFSVLLSERRVSVGCNARLPEHGTRMLDPVVRLTASCGEETVAGWGWTSVSSKEQARELLGMKVSALISPNKGVSAQGACVEAALWDLLGNILKVPVFRLLGATASFASVYFTHLYFSDLHLHSDEEACKLVAEEARAGLEQGHVAFKMKVGRGAMHMPLEAGTARDIALIKAVRNQIGKDAVLMIDANNGYNFNLARQVLLATKECNLYWLEEAFHEDPVLYLELKKWMKKNDIRTLIADGEGIVAATQLVQWSLDGAIDCVQYSAREKGFTFWLQLAPILREKGVLPAPHNFGSCVSCYTTLHLAAALNCSVEWDIGESQAFDCSRYSKIDQGKVQIPDMPGFGLILNDAIFLKSPEYYKVFN